MSDDFTRIIVLGIDGLEYSLVEEWKLEYILQRAHCRTDLSDYDVVVTPPLWGSMITGKIDREVMRRWKLHTLLAGMDSMRVKFAEKLGRFLPHRPTIWVWNHLVLPVTGGNPFESTADYVKKKNLHTIFHEFEKSWTNGLPGYGRVVSDSTARELLLEAFRGNRKPYIRYAIQLYKEDRERLFSALDRDYNLIFWYTCLLDKIGHVCAGNKLEMLKYYLEINQLAKKVKKKCPDAIIYIISDHGMKPAEGAGKWGVHSDYGFFSSSTGELISKPYHLYELLLRHAPGIRTRKRVYLNSSGPTNIRKINK